MRFKIVHENKSRMRIRPAQTRMTYEQADLLEYYLMNLDGVSNVKVKDRICSAEFRYTGDRMDVIRALQRFHYEDVEAPAEVTAHSIRPINAEFTDKLVNSVIFHFARKALWMFDAFKTVQAVWSWWKAAPIIWDGLKALRKGNIEVAVLDATALAVSLIRKDYSTVGSVTFLLGIGDLLEDWTRKRSVGDLARIMSLNVSEVWVQTEEGMEVLTPVSEVKPGDIVIAHTGNTIPFDGKVLLGEAMINQASLTGEPLPVRKTTDDPVFAGTAVEEGELSFEVTKTGSDSKYNQIVEMVENSENLKSSVENSAYKMADKLVPYTLGASALTYAFTQNVEKATSVLMVDFSCALKLSIPVAVLSAMREAGRNGITVKGGSFLEEIANADTIVFDKTGTLTEARPTVKEVVSFSDDYNPDELLRMAACLEEHFPHSIANAVVKAASDKGLKHEELHTKVEYIVSHGIASGIDGKRALIGSYHFLFEDEGIVFPEDKRELWNSLPEDCSHLYFALDGVLIAVILIDDPLRPEAPQVISDLRAAGFTKIVMMTGDSDRTAAAVARRIGVDEYYSEVLPEDKASFVEKERAVDRGVVMIGDGINDSPALSAANVGIAISDGAEIAREVADVTMSGENLENVVTLKRLSDALMKRTKYNYSFISTFNSALIGLGMFGILPPTATALLHNGSTIWITLRSMRDLLE